MAMWRAKLTPPKLGRLIGVSDTTIRNWQNVDHAARPSDADVLMLAVVLGVPVESLDPQHPFAGIRWTFGVDPDDPAYAPRDSNPEPSGVVPFPMSRIRHARVRVPA